MLCIKLLLSIRKIAFSMQTKHFFRLKALINCSCLLMKIGTIIYIINKKAILFVTTRFQGVQNLFLLYFMDFLQPSLGLEN